MEQNRGLLHILLFKSGLQGALLVIVTENSGWHACLISKNGRELEEYDHIIAQEVGANKTW